jgi:hypothetical protein
MSAYSKTIMAVVAAILTWGSAVVASSPSAISAGEWLALGFAVCGVLGVYAVPNSDPAP